MNPPESTLKESVTIDGANMTLDDVIRVARFNAPVGLSRNQEVLDRIDAAHDFIMRAVENRQPIYGVTTAFGGMAHNSLSPEEAAELQNNAISLFKCGAGKSLPVRDVRAAMLIRANSHMHGASGLRLELIRRLETFLNAGLTPHVPELGSIGASGDIVPLSYICGAIMGLDERFTVDDNGKTIGAQTALRELGLSPIALLPKEGLAMFNGTSVMTGIAVNCLYDAQVLLSLTVAVHALFVQAYRGTNQSFHPFIHQLKPHAGQKWTAAALLRLLDGSKLSLDESGTYHRHEHPGLIQDRYALRCIPQFLGPVVEGIRELAHQLEVEMNSANDNPLIDVDAGMVYNGGNFLGEYIGMGMDRLRYFFGLVAKHLDVQIGWLMTPEFNNGLPACLVGNTGRGVNMGLKGLQLVGNSIMPLLTFMGNSLADRFPTHAEQFNQNINSQGYGSANLTRQSVELFQQYMAICLITAVQGVDLRTYERCGHYDAREALSPETVALYEAVKRITGHPVSADRPFIWDDDDYFMDGAIAALASDIATGGAALSAVTPILESLRGEWKPT